MTGPDRDKLPEGVVETRIPQREGWRTGYLETKHPFSLREEQALLVAYNKERRMTVPLATSPFYAIDRHYNHRPLAMILRQLRSKSGDKVRILDAGGGVDSKMALGLLSHPDLAGNISVTNVDLFAIENLPTDGFVLPQFRRDDLEIINGDMATQTGLTNRFDLVFCMGVINSVHPDDMEAFLRNTIDSLAPGGEALILNEFGSVFGWARPILHSEESLLGDLSRESGNYMAVRPASEDLSGVTGLDASVFLYVRKVEGQWRRMDACYNDFAGIQPQLLSAIRNMPRF